MENNKKINLKEYSEFVNEWRSLSSQYCEMRYGQAFCNYFNITDSKLFYEKNILDAMSRIVEEFLVDDGTE